MARAEAVDWAQHHRNPHNWPSVRKWMVMATACWVTFIVGLNATSITTASELITSDFNLANGTLEVNFFAVTAWNAAAAIVPLITLPLMDTYGVKWGYWVAYLIFTILLIPQALAKDFKTLVASRAFAGAVGGTLQNAADGIAANTFLHHRDRVLPLTLYVFTLLFGVTIGPVLGAVAAPLGWRWIFWVELIICGASMPIVLLCMKESRGQVLHSRYVGATDATRSVSAGASTATQMLKSTIARAVTLLTTEPTVTFFTLWSSFAFGLVFISTQSIPLVFGSTYGWGARNEGLVQSALGIGELIGLVCCLPQNKVYVRSAARNDQDPGTPVPESILHLSIPSTIVLAGGLFMYGWSIFQSHWAVTALALGMIGLASMIIVNAASIYVTDSYSGYAASAIAAVAFGENIFAAFLPLAAKPMYLKMGYQWASSLLGFVAILLTLAPMALFWKGRAIREKSAVIRNMKLESGS